jgi:hypothetical protein
LVFMRGNLKLKAQYESGWLKFVEKKIVGRLAYNQGGYREDILEGGYKNNGRFLNYK